MIFEKLKELCDLMVVYDLSEVAMEGVSLKRNTSKAVLPDAMKKFHSMINKTKKEFDVPLEPTLSPEEQYLYQSTTDLSEDEIEALAEIKLHRGVK
jgi:hypothetical protein